MKNHSSYEEFLLSEYSNIAQAHFKSIESISAFFRYYLLLMSIIPSGLGLIIQFASDKESLLILLKNNNLIISFLFFNIASIGTCLLLYIANLRLDSILYARTINAIRNYFIEKSNLNIKEITYNKVLPLSAHIPPYHEKSYFWPVAIVFGIIDGIYFIIGLVLINLNDKYASVSFIIDRWFLIISLFAFIIILHLIFYFLMARYRELSYLKSNIIGIDIDGVLNKHRDQFCKILKKHTKIDLSPESIVKIPVHENIDLNISKHDERKVFNDPDYWISMPIIEDVEEYLNKIRNIFNMKIYIFTLRPWPDCKDKKELITSIKDFAYKCNKNIRLIFSVLALLLPFLIIGKWKHIPISIITKCWLKEKNIPCNKLFIEKVNDFSSDPRGSYRNRFFISRRKKIRFFVEDDLLKAIKLSYICEVVFLLNHPYNLPANNLPNEENNKRSNLPKNLIRVNSWNDIYQKIRELI
jgi:uncharacterized HAD superfamily protein